MKAGIKKQEVEFIVTDEYREWIALIKDRIKNSQIKASIKVNRTLLELYWHIGEDIVNRQKHSKWGEGLLRQMSIDLKKTFPDMSGFSENNDFSFAKQNQMQLLPMPRSTHHCSSV